jgi:hypothetical protein
MTTPPGPDFHARWCPEGMVTEGCVIAGGCNQRIVQPGGGPLGDAGIRSVRPGLADTRTPGNLPLGWLSPTLNAPNIGTPGLLLAA